MTKQSPQERDSLGLKDRGKKRKLPGCTGSSPKNSVQWMLGERGIRKEGRRDGKDDHTEPSRTLLTGWRTSEKKLEGLEERV